jgi:competence protein ComEA
MLRRGPDPLELATVLRRLESLRISEPTQPPGWVPAAPTAVPVQAVVPAAVGSVTSRLRLRAFDPGRRGVGVLAVVALLAAVAGAWYFMRAAPHVDSASVPAVAATNAPAAQLSSGWPTLTSGGPGVGGPTPSAAISIVVDVVGKVAKPGIITLPAASRIFDAIAAAGGALPGTDLTALNLAGKLIDGEEIFVGIPPPSGLAAQTAGGVVGGDAAQGGASGSTTPAVVDLNTATVTDLETLPGVGAVTAQRIIDWRTQHGRFTSAVQLQQVSGIGPSKYAALVGRVKV